MVIFVEIKNATKNEDKNATFNNDRSEKCTGHARIYICFCKM